MVFAPQLLRSLVQFAAIFGTTASIAAQSLPNGGSVVGTIPLRQTVTHTFSAKAGEGFQLRLVDRNATAFYPVLRVFDPSGARIANTSGAAVAGVRTHATRTGTYRVVIEDGQSSPRQAEAYRLYFARAPGANAGGALPNGGIVSGSIATGDIDSFTFSIRAGERFQVRCADVNSTVLYPAMTIYDPYGASVTTVAGSSVAATADRVAKFTGTYTVLLADATSGLSGTGPYTMHYVRVPGANAGGTLPNGGIVSAKVNRGELDSYTFPIVAGQNYELRLADVNRTTLYPRLGLYDPRGALVGAASGSTVAVLRGRAKLTGTYTVIASDVSSGNAAAGDYTLHYVRAPGANAGGALRSGRIRTGSIQVGELDSYTLSMNAGESFHLRVADTGRTVLYPEMRLFDPCGCLIRSANGSVVAALSGTANLTGTYTLVVSDVSSGNAGTGAYSLHYARAPGETSAGRLLNGRSVSATLALGELESYSFQIAAGQAFALRVADVDNTTFYPALFLYDTHGCLVKSASGSRVAALDGRASFSGRYSLVVADVSSGRAAGGKFELHFARILGANEGGYLLDGRAEMRDLTIGDLDTFTFRAKAQDAVRITVNDTARSTFYPRIDLYGPTGALLASVSNSTTAVLSRAIARDGTHTILVSDVSSGLAAGGPYTITIAGSGSAGNAGCSAEGPPALSGIPSTSTGFAIAATSSSRNCQGPSLVLYGPCAANPILLPPSLTCGTCGLVVPAAWGFGFGQVVIPRLPPELAGLSFCAQSVCRAGSCLTLSAGLSITLEK